jgi:hypothetical protein
MENLAWAPLLHDPAPVMTPDDNEELLARLQDAMGRFYKPVQNTGRELGKGRDDNKGMVDLLGRSGLVVQEEEEIDLSHPASFVLQQLQQQTTARRTRKSANHMLQIPSPAGDGTYSLPVEENLLLLRLAQLFDIYFFIFDSRRHPSVIGNGSIVVGLFHTHGGAENKWAGIIVDQTKKVQQRQQHQQKQLPSLPETLPTPRQQQQQRRQQQQQQQQQNTGNQPKLLLTGGTVRRANIYMEDVLDLKEEYRTLLIHQW